MPQRDKSSYTDKQTRRARAIKRSQDPRDVPDPRAWATVNTQDRGGETSGSGCNTTVQKRSTAASKERKPCRRRRQG